MAAVCTAVLLHASCSIDETFTVSGSSGQDGTVLSFTGDPMHGQKVKTRASDPKDEDEKRINQLYIFFFDQDGDYLEGSYLEGYPLASKNGGFYAPGEGVTTLKIANDPAASYFADQTAASSAIVYALANVDPAVMGFDELDEYGRPKEIKNMGDLEDIFYIPHPLINDSSDNEDKQLLLDIPAAGMPMAGKKTVDLTAVGNASANAEARTIELKALMARVDVNIRLETDDFVEGLPRLTMIDWTAMNIPTGASIGEPARDPADPSNDEYTTLSDRKVSYKREQYRQISNNSGEISLTFYMFENVQPAVSFSYPDDVKEDEKQRYKPKLANKDAAGIKLHCNYSTYNDVDGNATYDVTYTLYLGANHTDDFTVRRNHQYKNDIVIQGLIHHDDVASGNAYSFDARVNISHENNKYHIAILRERNHDAHFCVTPMDVYLFEDPALNPKLTVSVDAGWVGMEKISAAHMEDGTVPDPSVQHATGSWTAGNGKRFYFTTGLVNELKDKNSTVTADANRDRIYFYLDENLTMSNRQATVSLTYEDDETPPETRTLILEQVHLIEIIVYNRNDNTNEWTTPRQTIYMEQFEEYLQHYDPLDESTTEQIYTGLPWIVSGENYATEAIPTLYTTRAILPFTEVAEPHKVYYEGLQYTDFMIQLTDHQSMYLNGVPSSAFEYCYNKNKRTSSGTIPTPIREGGFAQRDWYEDGSYSLKWFLPGIRQMEDALKEQYTSYREFQEELYWSSAAGIRNSRQDSEHARATGVDSNGDYIHSNPGETNPVGNKLRTDICRIRAFRTDLNPASY